MKGISSRRLTVFGIGLALWSVALTARLVQLQVLRAPAYRSRARQQQERIVTLSPRRGSILDRQGRELAVSVEASSVFAVPEKIGDVQSCARALSAILGIPAREIREKLSSDRSFVWLARKVSDESAARIGALKLPGVGFLPEARRYYPNETLAASVLGYVGLDGQGLAGVEYQFEESIHGRPGQMRVSRDARQEQYALSPVPGREGKEGSSVTLSLDRDLQFVVESELARGVADSGARDASAIAMDPRTGEIFAMASYPTFDPNRYQEFADSAWRNRPIADSFEPGSAFKVVTGAVAIENGTAGPDDLIDCGQGVIQIGKYFIHDAEHERFGVIPLTQVIAKSSNVGIIRVGLRLGPERLYSGARMLGIGDATGIDLPGENPGLLREVSRWSALSNAEISMGQEVAVTPLQLAVVLSSIANGGYRVRPRVLLASASARAEFGPSASPGNRRVLSEATTRAMNEILKGVVAGGTGKRAVTPGYVVAGKTGTAQKAIGHGYAKDKYVATFAGYAPADDPRVVVVVTIDEPRGEYFASEVAAPVFGRILGRAMPILGVPPDGSVMPSRPASPPMIARGASPFAPGVVAASLARRQEAPFSRMPDLTGYPARRAVAELSRRGLLANLTGTGFVFEQSPAAGVAVEAGESCQLGLSENQAR
jgi:cell division protein FtsI (penicillin-binding protein 3)